MSVTVALTAQIQMNGAWHECDFEDFVWDPYEDRFNVAVKFRNETSRGQKITACRIAIAGIPVSNIKDVRFPCVAPALGSLTMCFPLTIR